MAIESVATMSEAAYLVEARDELELIDLYRALTPSQRTHWMAYARSLVNLAGESCVEGSSIAKGGMENG